jgi:recombinational DNA repair protein RecR
MQKKGINSNIVDIYEEFPSLKEDEKVIYLFDQNTGKYHFMSSGINNLAGYSLEELNLKGLKSSVG